MGQVCSAAKRFFVHHSIIDQFIDKLKEKLVGIETAPLYSDVAYEKLVDQVSRGLNEGAKLVLGDLEKLKNKQTDVFILKVENRDSVLLREEIFGPVFVITQYNDDAELPGLINGTRYGLGCSIYDVFVERAEELASKVESGMIFVNTFTTSKSELPWGGMKESGFGRDSWRSGIETFANLKTVKYANN